MAALNLAWLKRRWGRGAPPSANWERGSVGHSLFVIGGEEDEQISLLRSEHDRISRLVCIVRGETNTVFAPDFFEALALVRLHVLEPKGLIPFCYGASLDVWPSDDLREVERGLKARRIRIDGTASELVDIFDSGPDVIPARFAVQEDHARGKYSLT
jgi:hypothetical protein